MLNTSKDILYLVLSFCILWITVFICWLLYYFISTVGGVRKIVKGVEDKVAKVDALLNLVKEKVEHSATYLGLLVEGIAKVVGYLKDKKNNWRNNDDLEDNEDEAEEKPKKKFGKKIKVK